MINKETTLNRLMGITDDSAKIQPANAADKLENADIHGRKESDIQSNTKSESQFSNGFQMECPYKDELMSLIRDIEALLK